MEARGLIGATAVGGGAGNQSHLDEGRDRREDRPGGRCSEQLLPVDLIIVGTHGRTGLSHVLMGSVA
ncbi:MAG: universal stress protein, partial [Tepidiformaceae bacterium]